MESEFLNLIQYYSLERLPQHVLSVCLEAIQSLGPSPVFQFWKAAALLLQDRFTECLQELELLKDKKDMSLCSYLAIRESHRRCTNVNKNSVSEIEKMIKSLRSSCGERSLYHSVMFLWLIGKYDKSREYIERLLKVPSKSKDVTLLRGWIDLTSNRNVYIEKSIDYFEEVLENGGDKFNSLGALIGKSRYFASKSNFSTGLDVINEAVVTFPKSTPALIEKTRLQIMLGEWDAAVETCDRITSMEQDCIEAVHLTILYRLAVQGSHSKAVEELGRLIQLLDRREPQNHWLYYNLSLAISRICDRSAPVLDQTITLLERACALNSATPAYATELAYQLLLQGKIIDALKMYKKAFSYDDTSISALSGIIHCQILSGQLEEAKKQLDFLQEVQATLDDPAEVIYLAALLALKTNNQSPDACKMLEESMRIQYETVKRVPLGSQYYRLLNPDLICQAVGQLLSLAPFKPILSGQKLPKELIICSSMLDPISRSLPGLTSACLLQAKVKYLSGDSEQALSFLEQCLTKRDLDILSTSSGVAEANVLAAEIHLTAGNHAQASLSLDQALSNNFEVRNNPHYQFIKAKVSKKLGDAKESLKNLTLAISSTDLKSSTTPNKKQSKTAPGFSIGLHERASFYVELAKLQSEEGEKEQSEKTMREAKQLFVGSQAEARLQLAEAELAAKCGDIDKALLNLKTIPNDHSCYVDAVRLIADIYLNQRRDKKLFLQCYKDLCNETSESYVMLLLGDAYMTVHDTEKAIEIYERALKKNSKDAALARKIGQALVATHNYNKAIAYYQTSLKTRHDHNLLYDLAELHFRMKNYSKAITLLCSSLNPPGSSGMNSKELDIVKHASNTKYLILLARVHEKNGHKKDALSTWIEAHQQSKDVLIRLKLEKSEHVPKHKQLISTICYELAQIYNMDLHERETAIKFYRESILYNESSLKVRLSLAKIFLDVSDLENCQSQCSSVLALDEDNETAILMLGSLLIQKKEHHTAINHFLDALNRKPNNYVILANLLDFLRRAGRLNECPELLQKAEKSSSRASYEAGFNYCKGIYNWFSHCPNEALENLNKARRDSYWGEKAILMMVTICINPDKRLMGGTTFEDTSGSSDQQTESESKGINTAEKLLAEVNPKTHDTQIRKEILQCYILMMKRSGGNLDKASSISNQLISCENEHFGVAVLCATIRMLTAKEKTVSKNHLKSISKKPWSYETAEDYEQAILLLSDCFVQAAKMDYAKEQLKKILDYNQSCSTAWEYLGFIAEKDQEFKEASEHYEKAWLHSNESNPAIGYKLAFNYLKAKRNVDAIDVCHKVLEKYPNYPKIRREILDKARSSLRV